MREFVEPTMRNLLKQRLVAGVSSPGLVGLTSAVVSIQIIGNNAWSNQASIIVAVVGYSVLRVISMVAKPGWEEAILFKLEHLFSRKNSKYGSVSLTPAKDQSQSPDTIDEQGMISVKSGILEKLLALQTNEKLIFLLERDSTGAKISQIHSEAGKVKNNPQIQGLIPSGGVYSLYQLPCTADPLWFSSLLAQIPGNLKVILNFSGVNQNLIKAKIEKSRRMNFKTEALSHVESDVAFEEASFVLQGLIRGSDKILKCSVVILTEQPVQLDPNLFCKEKNMNLSIASGLGVRKRPQRSLFIRAITASDLYPSFLDPVGCGAAIMRTKRENPLYFNPQDTRLESLHWIVSGATGSGKSFFTGLVLKRMLDLKVPMSILFVDHNQSFKRFVVNHDGPFLVPRSLQELGADLKKTFFRIDNMLEVAGIELAELPLTDKKAATRLLLSRFESFLRSRQSTHPVYLVLDECWNFMREEPLLVQRTFREFRKLNGAAIAITQSLSDFLSDDSGRAIFQNAPIRILLRQGEDPATYRGLLSLNDTEIERLRYLRQEKGIFSECLIKTPYSSQLGRLFPSEQEHALLRTDNLREEMIRESRKLVFSNNQKGVTCR